MAVGPEEVVYQRPMGGWLGVEQISVSFQNRRGGSSRHK
jgi:hypothetical protein